MGQRPEPPRVEPAFDAVNDAFHDAYGRARSEAEVDAPVFVVLADALLVFRGSERHVREFTPPAFHLVKSAAHAPVAVFAALSHDRGGVGTMATHVAAARAAAAGLLPAGEVLADVEATFDATLALLTDAERRARDAGSLSAFAAKVGPVLLRLTAHATKMQLAALHDAVEDALAALSAEERSTLEVIVTGDHQARARSLAMQYFQERFGEAPGADERVTYAEGVGDEASALALVGTRRLDRAIARAFFGDDKRLQRDILGDAGAAELARMQLAPIG